MRLRSISCVSVAFTSTRDADRSCALKKLPRVTSWPRTYGALPSGVIRVGRFATCALDSSVVAGPSTRRSLSEVRTPPRLNAGTVDAGVKAVMLL